MKWFFGRSSNSYLRELLSILLRSMGELDERQLRAVKRWLDSDPAAPAVLPMILSGEVMARLNESNDLVVIGINSDKPEPEGDFASPAEALRELAGIKNGRAGR